MPNFIFFVDFGGYIKRSTLCSFASSMHSETFCLFDKRGSSSQPSPSPIKVTPHVQSQGYHHCVVKLKYRSTRVGEKIRDRLRVRSGKIPVVISGKLGSNKRLAKVKSGSGRMRTFASAKISKEPTAAKIVPRCMILNARSIVKPDATLA